jgi:DNA replication protein DnaC
MQQKLNFDAHEFLMRLRDADSKFLELDNRFRALAYKVGNGSATVKEAAEYKKLETKRGDTLTEFIAASSPAAPAIKFSQQTDKTIAKNLTAYCDKFPNVSKKNIVLYGATGTGKTYCAKIIAEKLKAQNFRVYFTSAYNLIKRMRENSFGADTATDKDFFASDLLIIDDLGTEPEHKNSDEYLYTVLSERYENDKPLIITTNLSPEQIFDKYDQRIAGRIFDKYKTNPIEFTGDDFRI